MRIQFIRPFFQLSTHVYQHLRQINVPIGITPCINTFITITIKYTRISMFNQYVSIPSVGNVVEICLEYWPLIIEHRKFSGNSFNFGNFRFLKKNCQLFLLFKYFTFVFKNVRRDIFGLYTFIMYMCWYINCLLYVHSFSLISNMSIILL